MTLEASAAPGYGGDPTRVDPEEMLVAALSNCHMLTFLAIAAKKRFVVESYRDEASGMLGTLDNKRMAVTDVTLRPRVVFGGPPETRPDDTAVQAMHHKAHEHCFIANSVSCSIKVQPS